MSDVNAASAGHRQVDIKEAVQLFFKNYVNFQGRSSRGAYWWWFLAYVIAVVILAAIGIELLYTLFVLAVLVPNISLGVRRLHDIGRSGFWLLIGLIPIVGLIVLIYFGIQPGQRATNRFGPDVEAGR